MNLRSKWEFGEARECRRGLLCGMGISPEEQARPLIGIVNSWNEYNPGHVHLKALAERVKQGVRDAGGFPVEVMTTGICDGMVLKDPKYVEIPSRNSIADQVEITAEGNFFDGMVMLSTCDSIVPGHLMAAARLDIPTVVVTGGYMPLGTFRGREVLHIHAQDKVGTMKAGKIDPDEYNGLIEHSWGTCGGCTSMTTANSMCMVAEALGMSLPGNSTVSAVSSELALIAYRAGERVMALVKDGITARQIITPASIRNAIKMDMAVAASSNLILHIPAIAHEAGYDEPWWKYFDEASNEIPLLAHLAPSGPYNLHDLDLAGGLPAVLKELLPKLDGDCLTVTGKTLAENVASAKVWNTDVIHTLAEPVMRKPGIGVLYGNLAPEGAIIKIAAVPEHLFTFTGPARVFDSLHAAQGALRHDGVHVPGGAEGTRRAVQLLRGDHGRALLGRHLRTLRRIRLARGGARGAARPREGRRHDRDRHPEPPHRHAGGRRGARAAQGVVQLDIRRGGVSALPAPFREERRFDGARRHLGIVKSG